MQDNPCAIIAKRRHEAITSKSPTWNLIKDSYIGGEQYRQGNHLIKYYRESTTSYKSRIDRAVYINHVQPLADICSGFLFSQDIIREMPASLEYLLTDAGKGKGLDSYMHSVAIQSMLYPVLVLVDSPAFDPELIKTKADRIENSIQPYCITYRYDEIRDFSLDDSGEIDWILLDNSYVDNSNPLAEASKKIVYRLWTREAYQDFFIDAQDGKVTVLPGGIIGHGLGRVPAVFVNAKSISDDSLESSVFESIALLSKSIFNVLSAMDETLYGGSFSTLFFPVRPGDDIPKIIKESGIGSLVIIPYDGELSQKPYFESAGGAINVTPYLDVLKLYIREIFRQIGFSVQEEDSRFWNESGVAKSVEFQKTEAFLRLVAAQLKETEKAIIKIAALWENMGDIDVTIEYPKEFEADSIDNELNRLYTAFTLPYKTIQKEAAKRISSLVFDDLDKKQVQEINDEIDQAQVEPKSFSANEVIEETNAQ